MSYMALYRKWRPKTFDEVKGQDAIVTTLKNQIKSGRIGHAYLFCGTRGTGKTSVAKIFARAVNCSHNEDGNPCNECEVCSAILNESSINVVEIDAASNNGVDNIRDIKEQVLYPPTEGKYKVFIIDEVHMLSAGAFNALLKTLEEPPEYVIFILATTEVHKIPVTVLSRCQRYDFKRIPVQTIVDRLRELTDAEGISMDDRALSYIAKQADGALRDAISLLDECVAFHPGKNISYDEVLEVLGSTDTEVFANLFDAIASARVSDALKIIEDAVKAGRELGWFTSDFLWYMRNLLIIKSADEVGDIIDASKENLEVMKASAARVSMDALARYIRIFAELSNSMKFSNQKRVLLELAIIKLITPQMETDLDSVLERLDRLEREPVRYAPAGERPATPAYAAGIKEASAPKTMTPQEVPREVTQPVAADDTLHSETGGDELASEWSTLIRMLGGPNTSVLKDTTVEVKSEKEATIVFHNSGCFNLGIRDVAVGKLRQLIKEKYGRDMTFNCILGNADAGGAFVTREELNDLIRMPIEMEE